MAVCFSGKAQETGRSPFPSPPAGSDPMAALHDLLLNLQSRRYVSRA
ncbi:hypothetical protein ABIB57_004981 [Devosia sp. UYZn731]